VEDVLVIIIQAIFEMLAYIPWDWFLYLDIPVSSSDRPVMVGFASLALGIAIGWLSLYFLPDVIARWPWLRISLLFVSPILSGLLASQMAKFRQRRDDRVDPWSHFWWSWAFTLGLVVVRFGFAVRAGH
jgi:hypothetical protein